MGITTTGGIIMDVKKINREQLVPILVVFELVLSVIFIFVGYLTGNIYFRGVGIGLLIAWVTGAIAYYVVGKRTAKP
ncbi:MAG: hypothetical protein WBQ58_09290 [Methanoregula sp.]|uniref:hypothetical protein n=2 Tax=Methanoregula sp. TaxID=2052170 RepID=UPI003BB0CE73